jgi:hypothetical protein
MELRARAVIEEAPRPRGLLVGSWSWKAMMRQLVPHLKSSYYCWLGLA